MSFSVTLYEKSNYKFCAHIYEEGKEKTKQLARGFAPQKSLCGQGWRNLALNEGEESRITVAGSVLPTVDAPYCGLCKRIFKARR